MVRHTVLKWLHLGDNAIGADTPPGFVHFAVGVADYIITRIRRVKRLVLWLVDIGQSLDVQRRVRDCRAVLVNRVRLVVSRFRVPVFFPGSA